MGDHRTCGGSLLVFKKNQHVKCDILHYRLRRLGPQAWFCGGGIEQSPDMALHTELSCSQNVLQENCLICSIPFLLFVFMLIITGKYNKHLQHCWRIVRSCRSGLLDEVIRNQLVPSMAINLQCLSLSYVIDGVSSVMFFVINIPTLALLNSSATRFTKIPHTSSKISTCTINNDPKGTI